MTYATQPAEQDSSSYPADSTDPEATAAVPPPPSALPGAPQPSGRPAPVDGTAADFDGTAADLDGEPVGEVYRSEAAADPSAAPGSSPVTGPSPVTDSSPVTDPSAAAGPSPVTDPSAAAGPSAATGSGSSPGLWGDHAVDRYRDRFREIQIRFVDEPGGATGEARDLVSELFQELWDTLSARKAEVDSWEDGDRENTEQLRTAVRRYRDLVDDLLAR